MAVEPIPIRAHSVLCLQGFRGSGYTDAFTEHMSAVLARLEQDPDVTVRVIASPDTFCGVCPHHGDGCQLRGPGHETHMKAQDENVLERLDLQAGTVLRWRDLLDRVAAHVRGFDLGHICGQCPWLPLGWCAEGVDAQRALERAEPPAEA